MCHRQTWWRRSGEEVVVRVTKGTGILGGREGRPWRRKERRIGNRDCKKWNIMRPKRSERDQGFIKSLEYEKKGLYGGAQQDEGVGLVR